MNVEVTMEDGKLIINGLKITPYYLNFEGIGLPDEFVAFFLNPQTKEEAVRLIRKTLETYPEPSKDMGGRKLVLEATAKGGLSAGWQMIASLQAAKPNGKPQFYRRLESDHYGKKEDAAIVLTDGTDAFNFKTILDVASLPPNVYCAEQNIWLTFTQELFDLAKQQTDEFFRFAKKIMAMHAFFLPDRHW
jgi:hypothetical protein